jgi:hypothetical protein
MTVTAYRDRDLEEAKDIVLREIDRAIEALTELRPLVLVSNADMKEAESRTGSILHYIGRLAQALDVPVPDAAV